MQQWFCFNLAEIATSSAGWVNDIMLVYFWSQHFEFGSTKECWVPSSLIFGMKHFVGPLMIFFSTPSLFLIDGFPQWNWDWFCYTTSDIYKTSALFPQDLIVAIYDWGAHWTIVAVGGPTSFNGLGSNILGHIQGFSGFDEFMLDLHTCVALSALPSFRGWGQ